MDDPTGVAQSCPLIDELLRFIESVSSDNEKDENYQADCERAIIVLEMIRKANMKLREFGCDEHDRANEFEKDLNRAGDRIDELEYQNKELQVSIEGYRAEIKDLENIVNT